MAIYDTTFTYSRKSYIFVRYKIQNTKMTHSTNHTAFSSINRNHDTMSFSQFLIAPNLWIWLNYNLSLLWCKLIVVLQSIACETLGLRPTNFHLPEFLTLWLNHKLPEHYVHQYKELIRSLSSWIDIEFKFKAVTHQMPPQPRHSPIAIGIVTSGVLPLRHTWEKCHLLCDKNKK